MIDRPTLLVAALVLDNTECILLTRHAPYRKWHLPDGDVRFGESLTDALVRSFEEDFGITPLLLDTNPWYVNETIREGRVHYVTHYLRAIVQKATPLKPREGLETMRLDLLAGYSVGGLLPATVDAIDVASWQNLL